MTDLQNAPRPHGQVPAVARALAVMDLLARERRPMHMAGLAAALSLPKSSVHGLCNTLLSHGYLRRAENGAMQIGPGVMSLADAFVANTNVASEFDALCRDAGDTLDETLILSVLSGSEVVYVGVRHGARPLGLAFNLGMRLPAHVAATGKAMLAYLPPDVVLGLLPRGFGTVAQRALADELAETRRRGHAIDDGGVREGVVSLAAPVFGASGEPVAGVAVCINKSAMTPEQHAHQLQVVVGAGRRLSARLGARVEAL